MTVINERWETTPATRRLCTLLVVPGVMVQHVHAPAQSLSDIPMFVVASMGGYHAWFRGNALKTLTRAGLHPFTTHDHDWVFLSRDVAPEMFDQDQGPATGGPGNHTPAEPLPVTPIHYTAIPSTAPTWDGLRAGIDMAMRRTCGLTYNFLGIEDQIEITTRALEALYTGIPIHKFITDWFSDRPHLLRKGELPGDPPTIAESGHPPTEYAPHAGDPEPVTGEPLDDVEPVEF